ncbi:MAG: choice-of-anchor A family protein [Myxococcaceae bacterium]|nr:choice-of-anchor A family protein [Myxococcaceae bacterium]
MILNDFNLFVLGDYSGGHDVLGKVAAGGNVSLQYFAVGAGLTGEDRENVLVAGGDLNITYGSVYGDGHYAGSTTADETVSFLGGALAQAQPLDFSIRAQELMAASESLSYQAVTGTTTIEPWGGVMLQGSEAELNVFEVEASAFASAVYFSISVPEGSMALVNVLGEAASFSNFGHGYSGVDATGVLFNFPSATSITASSFGFFGTVLAPYAHVTFDNGSWDGGLYAASFSGNAEGHIAPLRDIMTCDGGGNRW